MLRMVIDMIGLTGGKTGGHIVPLIAVEKQLEDEVLYVGGKDSLEEKLCHKHDIPFIGLPIRNKSFCSVFQSYRALRKSLSVKPKAILSTGGYVSVPLILYAVFHHIPIYLLEENVIMGSANHFFSFFAKTVFLSYPIPKMKKKYRVIGQPLLNPSLSYSKYSHYSFDVLIVGGSLGSKPLCDLAEILSESYRVCLVCGRYQSEYLHLKRCIVLPYVEDIMNLMLHAKIIISRAGAATTAEIFSLEKPCILIPSMKTKKNHQYLNALYFEQKNCCVTVLEKNAKKKIVKVVEDTLHNESILVNMRSAQRKMVNRKSSQEIATIIARRKSK